MRSLRKTALLWLSILLGAVGLAATAISYLSVQDEADDFLDNQLRQIAFYVDTSSERGDFTAPRLRSADPEDNLLVQVWDGEGRLVRSSDRSVAMGKPRRNGFLDATIGSDRWRAFARVAPARTVQVAQRIVVREELAADAAIRSAFTVAILIPLSWLLLGFVIHRVMSKVDDLAKVVEQRGADEREPIPQGDVPSELVPFVRAMNALLARLQDNLVQQRNFVSDAAHELRTPLTALSLQIANLRRVARGRAMMLRLDDLEAGAQRATRLVNQLLRLARHEVATGEARTGRVDLGAVVLEASQALRSLASDADVELEALAAPMLVRGTGADLRIMVTNIIENALLHTRSGGRVSVRLRADGERFVIEVTDTGPGIAVELRSRAFERFFRASDTNHAGSGLGLAIAKAIADAHAMTITLHDGPSGTGLLVRIEGERDTPPARSLV